MTTPSTPNPSRGGPKPPSAVSAPRGAEAHLENGSDPHPFPPPGNEPPQQEILEDIPIEDTIMRILMTRLYESIRNHELTPRETITALRALTQAVFQMENLHRARRKQADQASFRELLKAANFDLPEEI